MLIKNGISFFNIFRNLSIASNGFFQYYNISGTFGGNLSRVYRNSYRFSTHATVSIITGSAAATTATSARIKASRGW